jgi:hypothetical protein
MKNNIFLLLILIIQINLCGCIFGTGYGAYVDEKIKPLTIKGIIVGKYKEETGCFGAIIINQDNEIDTLKNIFICAFNDEKIWRYVLPNDSIYKQNGSLATEIVRNGKSTKFTFPTRD